MNEEMHTCQFNGTCCQCGAAATAENADGSASFQHADGCWAVANVIAVICDSRYHAYYTLDFRTEVRDPVTAEEEAALLRGE